MMPSEIKDERDLMHKPSSFSDETCFPVERRVGFWKSESMPGHHVAMEGVSMTSGNKSDASSPLEKFSQMGACSAEGLEIPQAYIVKDQKANPNLERHLVGSERTSSLFTTSRKVMDQDLGSRSNLYVQPESLFVEGGMVGINRPHYENGLFSSSWSETFSKTLRLSSNDALFGQSVDAIAPPFDEDEPFESLEEIEAQTIGNLLPDDDEFFSGVIDELECIARPNTRDDGEDFDLFTSVGGMELEGDDSLSCFGGQKRSDFIGEIPNGQGESNSPFAGQHPYGSRTLFVRNIDSNVEDSELRVLFEQYGDIRTLYTACKHLGFVMISYYDIREARNAMRALQNKTLACRKLDIHFSFPKDNPSEKDVNHGTLVVFNLDSSVSNDDLHQIFGAYGEIKEIRETPHKRHHKFIEFYDVRAAEAALRALNWSNIAGKRIKLEPSRPGGARRVMRQLPREWEPEVANGGRQLGSPHNDSSSRCYGSVPHGSNTSSCVENGAIQGLYSAIRAPISPFVESAFHGISSSIPHSLTSPVRFASVSNHGNQPGIGEPSHSLGHMKFGFQRMPAFGSSGSGTCSLNGQHCVWSDSDSYHPHLPFPVMQTNSPSFVNGVHTHHPHQMHVLPRAPSHMLCTMLPLHHHVGSAPTVNPSVSAEASMFHPGSLGSMGFSGNSTLHPLELASHNILPHVGGNSMDPSITSPIVGVRLPQQSCRKFPIRNHLIPMPTFDDAPNERVRRRRNKANSIQADNKKQFDLDIDRILHGEDTRTTIMIKNIPNKYTSKMLLATIDEHHRGTYDFIYLPIDFKNKCNVGYAFINLIDPMQIVPFFQEFNGKKWEKFNSEKVASLSYARIQGKAALIAHFQNSSLMNEDKRCRPILFCSEGPNAGDQEPFPTGVNIRSRPIKSRTNCNEECHQGSLPTSANGEEDSSSDSAKDSE
ncbi:protein MEI2-like 4 [Tasmannia lanceolata]|uniref:protein MEI2-like 4 n=1 Tax=Tasmannia lanceolata TaxID=3420 RepID=UPI00406436CA